MSPRLSILIVNWNGWRDLEKCLTSILRSTYSDLEIVVIDNNSSDGSVQNLAARFPQVRVHLNQANLGHTRAVNQGFRIIKGRYVLVLDADTELEPTAIETMMHFIESTPSAAVVAPRTLNTDGTLQETARELPTAMSGLFGRQSVLTRMFPNNRISARYLARDRSGRNSPYEVRQVSAACMLFERRLVDEIGPWDESYFAYWVDTDWCIRVTRSGRRIFCVPGATIVHHESNARGKKKSARRVWAFHRGAYILYRRHYTFGALDPRAVIAGLALLARALVLIGVNHFRSSPPRIESAALGATAVPNIAGGTMRCAGPSQKPDRAGGEKQGRRFAGL